MAWNQSPHSFGGVLFQIKQLFIQRHYRQCASLCASQISKVGSQLHAVELTYLYFYAGLSYDCLARSMNHRSGMLQQTINLAERYFVDAATTLPLPALAPLSPQYWNGGTSMDTLEASPSRLSSGTASNRNSVESGISEGSNITAATDMSTLFETDFPASIKASEQSPSRPPPLKLGQPPRSSTASPRKHLSIQDLRQVSGSDSSPAKSHHSRSSSFPRMPTIPDEEEIDIFSPNPYQHWQCYNAHLTSFGTMLKNHIKAVRDFRRTVAEQIQKENSEASDSLATFSFDAEESREERARTELQERIMKGRMRGWTRKRFDPSRYETLCREALTELV